MPFRVGIVTISDRVARGGVRDESGPLLRRLVEEKLGATVVQEAIVPDEMDRISQLLRNWVDEGSLDLILTTGGTGFAFRDVTPEATRQVIEREAPGLAEAMRAAGLQKTPHAMLSRAVAGIRGHTLIINLPGSPTAVEENLAILLPALSHALSLLRGAAPSPEEHRPPS